MELLYRLMNILSKKRTTKSEIDKAIQVIEENADRLTESQRMHVENISYLILKDID